MNLVGEQEEMLRRNTLTAQRKKNKQKLINIIKRPEVVIDQLDEKHILSVLKNFKLNHCNDLQAKVN
jgi:hypothetical protein